MKLMKELQVIREGAVKDAVMDLIDAAIRSVDITTKNYNAALKQIAHEVNERDHRNLVAGMSEDELIDLIKAQFEPGDLKEAEEDPSTEETNEKIIGKADEFKVILNTDTLMVDILDGEELVRLTMSKDIWDQLKRQ